MQRSGGGYRVRLSESTPPPADRLRSSGLKLVTRLFKRTINSKGVSLMHSARFVFLVLNASILVHSCAFGQSKEWVDDTGKYRVEAEFLRVEDETLWLKKADGTEISVPFARLSDSSRNLALKFQSQKEQHSNQPKSPVSKLISPGEIVDYKPFFPDLWKGKHTPWNEKTNSTRMYPWIGERVVFLTTDAKLDRKTMAVFLERLDGGWELFEKLIQHKPNSFKEFEGKPTIAAVPNAGFTCGYGCGYVGLTGIEVAGFYKSVYGSDLDIVKQDKQAFPDYYFYEMGRNYFVFGDRHSLFTTGFAVFMRYVCMDALDCKDPNLSVRETIEKCETYFAESELSFLRGFTNFEDELNEKSHRLTDPSGKPVIPSDQPVIYAAAMLKLRKDYGGDEWVKRFFSALMKCPEVKPDDKQAALRQSINWLVAASIAAKEDLTPVFVGRWRMPLSATTLATLREVDWNAADIDPKRILDELIIELP